MHTFELVRMAGELSLGIGIKLFCDNGRIHWRDFVNDFLFWVPGVNVRKCDGLGYEVDTLIPADTAFEAEPMKLAAK